MNISSALVVAPHCNDPTSEWFSPGRSTKLSQVLQILQQCDYKVTLLNTCPIPNIVPFPYEIQISRCKAALPRLISFLNYSWRRPPQRTPSLIWLYNSRLPEALMAWRIRRLHPKAFLIVELEDLPAARISNASWRGWLDWLSTWWLVRQASLVTCVSEGAARALKTHLAAIPNQLRILPPLLHIGFLEAVEHRHRQPFESHFTRVLYAGGYEPEKGVEDLLWAISKLPSSQFRLHLAGPASLPIRELASFMPNVYVHGTIDQQLLHRLYQHADIVVNPHRSIHHGSHVFPFKSIEQAASGALPLLSTALGPPSFNLPKSCLFSSREELLKALAQSKQNWMVNRETLTALASSLRQSHSLQHFAQECNRWIQEIHRR